MSFIVGFLKVRNEIIRNGNIYRCLANLEQVCDDIYAIDDASYDGTYEYLVQRLGEDHVLRIPPEQHNFGEELKWKQALLQKIHRDGPHGYILWQDADEVLDAKATLTLRQFCKDNLENTKVKGWSFHYTQLWVNSSYARTDDGFDGGQFLKLWRYSPDLTFDVILGTHQPQMPQQILRAFYEGNVVKAPFDIIHYGNYGVNLKFKCIQYWGGMGGVERHMFFENGTYRKVPDNLFPEGVDLHPDENPPTGWTADYIDRLKDLQNMEHLKDYFCVIIPTNNRAHTLRKPLDSLLAQTYQKWFAVVLDDGSTDGTEELMWEYQQKDPRFFYVKYFEQRGGVAMHNIGAEIAIHTAEWWTRLGSDDVFYPKKLEYDAIALKHHPAVYGIFEVHRKGQLQERGNTPVPADMMIPIYLQGGFFCSWANVAVSSEVLRQAKERFGNHCDPRLRNMEDCLVNFRITKVAPWTWRGMYKGSFVINPPPELCSEMTAKVVDMEPEAYWNAAETGGASSPEAMKVYATDRALTTQIINRENLK